MGDLRVKAGGTLDSRNSVCPADLHLLPTQEGCLWPSESTVSGSGIPEVSPGAAPPPPRPCPQAPSLLSPIRSKGLARGSLSHLWAHTSSLL